MTKRAGALAVVALASAAGAAGGCHPLELRRGPACVSGFQPGQNLTVRLGAVYDAKSDFLYKDSWLGQTPGPHAELHGQGRSSD